MLGKWRDVLRGGTSVALRILCKRAMVSEASMIDRNVCSICPGLIDLVSANFIRDKPLRCLKYPTLVQGVNREFQTKVTVILQFVTRSGYAQSEYHWISK